MDAKEFTKLYAKKNSDEGVTPFQNEAGFSLIRLYPASTPYHKDGKRMFIKVAVLERGFFYSVNMTKPEKREETTDYIIVDGEEYKRKVTNFISDGGEFSFDGTTKKIIYLPTKKTLTLNEFIEILAANHLSDRLFWKRKLNALANATLKILFWLSDKHYDRVKTAVDKHHFKQNNTYSEETQKNIDPFFKYFLVSRNTLFLGLVVAFCVTILITKYEIVAYFTVANPLVVLAFFLLLSICEKISIWLDASIKYFFMQKKFYDERPNLLEYLHDYQYQNKFNLKLNIQTNRKE